MHGIPGGGLGGASALGGTVNTVGTLGASALGASALHLLTRSSTQVLSYHPHLDGDLSLHAAASHLSSAHQHHTLHGLAPLSTLASTTNPLLGASLAATHAAPHAALVSSDVRTQHVAAGLYSQLDQFYLTRQAQVDESPLPPGMRADGRLDGRLPPLAGTHHGDYELAPAPPAAPPPPAGPSRGLTMGPAELAVTPEADTYYAMREAGGAPPQYDESRQPVQEGVSVGRPEVDTYYEMRPLPSSGVGEGYAPLPSAPQ